MHIAVKRPVMVAEQMTGFPLHRIHRTLTEERREDMVRGVSQHMLEE